MNLPAQVLFCMKTLEKTGHAVYAVGGCVRDFLLHKIPSDYDLCTSASPEETEQAFAGYPLVLAGKKHGTVGVILDGNVTEITTFRKDGSYTDSRRPDWVDFVPDIETDLARRDFTVNAMAYSPSRGFCDPFGGREDLNARILRTVGDPAARFREDPLRILRGLRFALTYDLSPEEATLEAMLTMAPLLQKLAAERIWAEFSRILPRLTAEAFVTYEPILGAVIPELTDTFDYDQRNFHHHLTLDRHIAQVTAALPEDPALRLAGLLHDIGKPACFFMDKEGVGHFWGHDTVSAEMADTILRRLKVPNAIREETVTLVQQHMTLIPPDKRVLRRRIGKFGEETFRKMLILQKADAMATTANKENLCRFFDSLWKLLEEIQEEDACFKISDLAVDGNDLIKLGFRPGPGLGEALNALLHLVQNEEVPNEASALKEAAAEILKEESL